MDNVTLQGLVDQIGFLKVKLYRVEVERNELHDKVLKLTSVYDRMNEVRVENEDLKKKNTDLEAKVASLKQQITVHLEQKAKTIVEKLNLSANDSAIELDKSTSTTSSPQQVLRSRIIIPPKSHNTQAMYVGNLTNEIDKVDLIKFFEKFGKVTYFTIPPKSAKLPSGSKYGFMKFNDKKTVDKILAKSNLYKVKGVDVLVSPAEDKYP